MLLRDKCFFFAKYVISLIDTKIELVDAQECSALAYKLVMLHQWPVSS
ncbi:unnamed protein product, partial [Brassica napus]